MAELAGPDGLSVEETFRVARVAYSHGAIAALVRVDPELGAVHVERLVLGYDVGRAVNPRLIEGQLQGAAVQALGGALLEEFVYDEEGNPLATSFMDYLLPTLGDAPEMTVLIEEVPATTNPLGTPGAIRQVPMTPELVSGLASLASAVGAG